MKGNLRDHGEKAVTLSSALTTDALAAEKMLAQFDGVTLQAAARFYIQHHDRTKNTPTVAAAFDNAITRRGGHSAIYLKRMGEIARKLPKDFAQANVFNVKGGDIAAALDSMCGKATTVWKNYRRTISAVFGDCVKLEYIDKNPCLQMIVPRNKSESEVVILSPEQVKRIFENCIDHPSENYRLCASCIAPFALLIFAGIRPRELERMTWDAINGDYIRLSGSITKTGRTRNIHISATLKAWLDTVPLAEREGKIVPPEWQRKAQRVRKESGIDGSEFQDAPRHTFGSFTVTTEGIDYVRACMGHSHTAVFETHYLNALTIPQAKKYMEIMPTKAQRKRKGRAA